MRMRKIFIGFGLLACSLLFTNSFAEEKTMSKILPQLKPLLDSEWKKLEPNASLGIRTEEELLKEPSWVYSISPALPSVWPPNPKLVLVYYVYALGLAPLSLVDGVYVAAPWARVEVGIKRETFPEFKLLSNKIKEIGI